MDPVSTWTVPPGVRVIAELVDDLLVLVLLYERAVIWSWTAGIGHA